MVTVAVFFFHIPLTGSVALLYASMAVYLLALLGVGLFISSLAGTQQQAILGTFAFMVPMMLLSGFASPVENMPDWLQYRDARQPDPALHGDRQRHILEGDAGRRRAEQLLAPDLDRGGDAHGPRRGYSGGGPDEVPT